MHGMCRYASAVRVELTPVPHHGQVHTGAEGVSHGAAGGGRAARVLAAKGAAMGGMATALGGGVPVGMGGGGASWSMMKRMRTEEVDEESFGGGEDGAGSTPPLPSAPPSPPPGEDDGITREEGSGAPPTAPEAAVVAPAEAAAASAGGAEAVAAVSEPDGCAQGAMAEQGAAMVAACSSPAAKTFVAEECADEPSAAAAPTGDGENVGGGQDSGATAFPPPRGQPTFVYDPLTMPLPELDDRGQPNWFVKPDGMAAPVLPPAPPAAAPQPVSAARAEAAAAHEAARAAEAFSFEVERRAKAAGVVPEEAKVDEVRYGQPGWKDRYYASKLKAETIGDRARVCEEYVRGLCWVLRYYYQGCPSWEWFYPYHYAPPASDLVGMSSLERVKKFSLGEPFSPLEQLMAVLPPRSARRALPECFASLMEPGSPLAHLYPEEFEQDLNGANSWWKAVAILPFIDRALLRQQLDVRVPILHRPARGAPCAWRRLLLSLNVNPRSPLSGSASPPRCPHPLLLCSRCALHCLNSLGPSLVLPATVSPSSAVCRGKVSQPLWPHVHICRRARAPSRAHRPTYRRAQAPGRRLTRSRPNPGRLRGWIDAATPPDTLHVRTARRVPGSTVVARPPHPEQPRRFGHSPPSAAQDPAPAVAVARSARPEALSWAARLAHSEQ